MINRVDEVNKQKGGETSSSDSSDNDDGNDQGEGDDARESNDMKLPINEYAAKWDEMYGRLLAYREKHGHCLVPNRYDEDPQLGTWVSTQRRHYKLKHGENLRRTPLTSERENLLKDIDFEWAAKNPRTVPWDTRFMQLLDFVATNGHAQVPIKWKDDPKLSNWVSTQRQEYASLLSGRDSRITRDQIQLLNSIGFVWKAQRGGTRRLHGGGIVVPSEEAIEAQSSSNFQAVAKRLLQSMREKINTAEEYVNHSKDLENDTKKSSCTVTANGTTASHTILNQPIEESSAASRLSLAGASVTGHGLPSDTGSTIRTPPPRNPAKIPVAIDQLTEYVPPQQVQGSSLPTNNRIGSNSNAAFGIGALAMESFQQATIASSLNSTSVNSALLADHIHNQRMRMSDNILPGVSNQRIYDYAFSQQLFRQGLNFRHFQLPFSTHSFSHGMPISALQGNFGNVSQLLPTAQLGGLTSAETANFVSRHVQNIAASNTPASGSTPSERSDHDDRNLPVGRMRQLHSPTASMPSDGSRPNKKLRKKR